MASSSTPTLLDDVKTKKIIENNRLKDQKLTLPTLNNKNKNSKSAPNFDK